MVGKIDRYASAQKDFVANSEYAEGWAGDVMGVGGEQIDLAISDAPTDTFKTPALLGTWLSGLGGNTVKASTEHYSVMQNVLSDQGYLGDPNAHYPLDDNLKVISGKYEGMLVENVIPLTGGAKGTAFSASKASCNRMRARSPRISQRVKITR